MSRSYRKTSICGNTTCRSEKKDKKIWHSRWRSKQRVALKNKSLDGLADELALLEKEVSSVWDMGKDGHHYFSRTSQQRVATRLAKKGKTTQERHSLKQRWLHKLMSK